MKPDPRKSFWKDALVSPFPVKYAKVKDRRGVEWEIGYIDEYCGKQKNPQTLVIVHGKGAFAAHYGYLIKYAVERGYRVIAPDMPQWGMSGPGNLDKPMARTLDDVRDAFHALIVDKLGVKKAFYHGHSLGGQVVLGYALRYPDTVQGLILEAPAGLEEYPMNIKMGDKELPLFDKSYAHDIKRWHEVWDQTGLVAAEGKRDEQSVRDFFYFKSRDPKTGAVTPSYAGYFKRDTEYSRLHTDQRVAMISGNKRELDQWVFMFIYDLYSIGSELVKSDPASLYKQLTKIKAPIFLAFGAQEPFIPGTPLNGLNDLANDIINPFMTRMSAAGRWPVLKVYPGVGHFIHTDVPYEFAHDTVDFMKTGRVHDLSPEAVDALINGAQVATDGGGSPEKPGGLAK
jgi:pimeloyl-ACP methyl ester carboxylesterase